MSERFKQIAIVAFILFAVGFTLWHVIREVPRVIHEKLIGRTEQHVDLGVLVTQVRELSRLETASMRVMHISTAKQSYGMVPDSLAGDSMQFLAVGDVIAGIDLSSLRREDVRMEPDGTLILKLPPPQVLVTRVDNRESHVMSRKTGMFRKQDINLESRARAYAEAGIRSEAIARGILPLASSNGEKKLGEFLHTVGFQKIRFVRGTSPPNGG